MNVVANTILRHLGGEHFIRMTGAENISVGNDFLMFCLPEGQTKNGINKVKITIDPSATYSVEARKMNWLHLKLSLVEQANQIQAAELPRVLSRMTGLDTTI